MSGEFAVHVVNGGKGKGKGKGGHRRRKNPEGRSREPLIRVDWTSLGWMLFGDLWIAYITRTWSGDDYGTSLFDGKKLTSPYQGQAWNLKRYMFAAATGYGIARLMGRSQKTQAHARAFMNGVKFGILRRLVWTEGFARSTWAQKYFGDITDAYRDGGAVWMAVPGGYQQAMDGPQVADQTWMMRGPQVPDQRWMMLGTGDDSPMGHAIIGPDQSADLASYQYTGDADPYSSAYASSY